MSTIAPLTDDQIQSGFLYSRVCTRCGQHKLVLPFCPGFTERPSGRNLFAVYGLDGQGHSTLRGVLSNDGQNFSCLRCHSLRWITTVHPSALLV